MTTQVTVTNRHTTRDVLVQSIDVNLETGIESIPSDGVKLGPGEARDFYVWEGRELHITEIKAP